MQEMYKGIAFSPNAILTKAIGPTDSVIEVSDISVFPDGPNLATIGTDEFGETISYATKVDNKLSGCIRGVEGEAHTWQANEIIARNFTNRDLQNIIENIENLNTNKVEKSVGKGLSEEDYTTIEKEKLSLIEEGANKTTLSDNISTDDSSVAASSKAIKSVNDKVNTNKVDLNGLQDDFTLHEEGINSIEGRHNFRYWEETAEVKVDGEWIEIRGGGGSSIKLGNVLDLTIEPLVGLKNKVSWKDSLDIILEGITLAKWGGTQLRRKLSTYPIDQKDGELVVDNIIRDQYENGYLDEGLTDGQKYFYALFPYTDDGVITVDVANRVEATAFEKYIQSAPGKPTIGALGALKVTVSSDVGSVVSLNQVDWFTSPHEFTGLIEDETYVPYAKFKETVDKWESDITPGDSFIAINKLPQDPPSAPDISNLSFDEVTVTGISGTEVKLDDGEWLNSPQTYTGLIAETGHMAYARMKETETMFASDSSIAKEFTTPSEGDDTTNSPGPKILLGGDMNAGYFGVVPASELFTGAEIALACGITEGAAQFNDVGWLKFAIDGEIIFKSQKTYRHSISWDHIHSKGCVLGTKEVTKDGSTYKVRLMKGALTDPSLYDAPDRGAKGSEWNRLMLPIHIQAKDKSWAYPAYVEEDIPYWGIDFTDDDLHVISSAGDGNRHWCQEVRNTSATHRVYRGGRGVSFSVSFTSSLSDALYGWSPVLEWVS